ncbi:hypothetical protein CAEBREN_06810 [Caenorhabditis brenneri]|uniref:EB domain-containing protein n=1 Tax=Caenorhabditis brenneri TaxID=135651 RepID=G0MVD4_CAEBE|nr:hypothetical protein CAEBREN_06810 [Caenorhabditis brenneri]
MNRILILLLVFFAVGCFSDCQDRYCSPGFECREGKCTPMESTILCKNDTECPGSDLCGGFLICSPFTSYFTCDESIECGEESMCISGICRGQSEPAFGDSSDAKSPPECGLNKPCSEEFQCRDWSCSRKRPMEESFAPAMKCEARWQCPTGMSCTKGFCT